MILMISWNGDGVGLSRRIFLDGHPITLFLSESFNRKKEHYKGLCPQVMSFEEGRDLNPEAVVFESSGFGALADELRQSGVSVWGAGSLQDSLESNRGWGIEVMAKFGIRIPQTLIFTGNGVPWNTVKDKDGALIHVAGHVDEAIALLKSIKGRWVFKAYDNESSADTFISDNDEEMVEHLIRLKERELIKPHDKFLIQKFIKGIELSTEVWVQNGVIIPGSANATIEEKKFLAGDLGPNTGAQTSVVWAYRSFPRILRETIGNAPFVAWLRNPIGPDGRPCLPYHGPLDLNCIISEETKKPYGLEWTPRMGWNAYYALAELFQVPMGHLFTACAKGQMQFIPFHSGYGYVIQVSIPPFPGSSMVSKKAYGGLVYEEVMKSATGIDIGGPTQNPHVWLRDAKWDGKNLETAGVDGMVLECSGRGTTVEEACSPAHALVEQIDIDNKQARIVDGPNMGLKQIAQMQEIGYEVE